MITTPEYRLTVELKNKVHQLQLTEFMTEAYDRICFEIYEGMKTLGVEKDFDYYYNNAPIFVMDLTQDKEISYVKGTSLITETIENKKFLSFRNKNTLVSIGVATNIIAKGVYATALTSLAAEIYRTIHE